MFTDYLRCGPRWYLTELPLMMAYRTEERIGLVGVPVLVLLQFRGDRHVVQYRCPVRVSQAIAEFAEAPGMITGRDL
ncbi:MAG: hypothetical protein M3017_07935 [Actinomycetota bacterium]|nr:hypothetical protein [Actinomycetota bacterium]